MGIMTFLLPEPLNASAARELERSYVTGGPDNIPWLCHAQTIPGRLTIQREVEESGFVAVPWLVEGIGQLCTSSATLMERPQPYHLPLELARGKINQVRGQAYDWQSGGLVLSPEVQEGIWKAVRVLSQSLFEAAAGTPTPQAQEALLQGLTAAERLIRSYVEQVFRVRHQRDGKFDTAFGCRLFQPPPKSLEESFLKACNGICVPFRWSMIEPTEGTRNWEPIDALLDWAEAHQLQITGGPLLNFSAPELPDWLLRSDRDLQGVVRAMANYVGAIVRRYRPRIRRWHLSSGMNRPLGLKFNEEEILWLTVRLAQCLRQLDQEGELLVGISQPWGEYMASEERIHSPFIFADTLIRSDLSLTALDLELVMGVSPRGSYCRDLLDTSRLLDLYALLGVPLHVTIGYPAEQGPDALAQKDLEVGAGHWRSGFSNAIQADWASDYVPLILCKPYVQALHWIHVQDTELHQFPHCGLIEASGEPRPVLGQLERLRSAHVT